MAGFVYACHPEADFARVKIGFTTSDDPVRYCKIHHARTLCPLAVLCTSSHANARVAEQVVHLILSSDRIDNNHEVFDLSTHRKGMSGLERLQEALNAAQHIDHLSGLPVPVAKDTEAEVKSNRKRKLAEKENIQQIVRDTRKRIREEFAAKLAAEKETERCTKKAEAQASTQPTQSQCDAAELWIDEHVIQADGGNVCELTAMFQTYSSAASTEHKISRKAFKSLAINKISAQFIPGPAKGNRKVIRNFWTGVSLQ